MIKRRSNRKGKTGRQRERERDRDPEGKRKRKRDEGKDGGEKT